MNKFEVGYIVNYEGCSQFFKDWADVLELLNAHKDRLPTECIEIKRCVYIKEPNAREGFHELIGWRV